MAAGSAKTGLKIAAGAVGIWLLLKVLKLTNVGSNVLINFYSYRLGGSFINPEVYITFKVTNPTDSEVTISQLYGNVTYQGQTVANVYSYNPIKLQKRSDNFLEVNAISSITDLIPIITSRGAGDFYFVGTIKVDGISLPLNFKLFDR